jgi:hypothetical protein
LDWSLVYTYIGHIIIKRARIYEEK